MTAEIISVGTELLMGQIVDTNAQYISQRLAEAGINQYFRVTVGDNHGRLYDTIRTAVERADLVILTGGLGPTEDDLTKETAADVMGYRDFVLDQGSYEAMEKRFSHMHRIMTANNRKQAMFPKEATILPNANGTAPGCILEKQGKAVILLPGPPKEMVPMFDDSVMPYLLRKTHGKLYSRILRIYGMGESAVEDRLRDLIDAQTNPTIAPYAMTGETTLRITARCKDNQDGEALAEPVIRAICQRLGDVVYSTHGEQLQEVCAALLSSHGKTLAVAESFTGGLLASTLISVPGSSAWMLEGCTTYSNGAKIRRLGVSSDILSTYGAISPETALEMARGMRASSGADFALSTTGIAGPDGGTPQKPVGLAYIALSYAGGEAVHELRLVGNRERIRNLGVLEALDMLRRQMENSKNNTCK
ncbi:MAG: competence/damage-inducible protein A [Candidatus Pelethousia sp.]|nr:competence/damage-inducible protein A [Candidatus Pelethousia sp.]